MRDIPINDKPATNKIVGLRALFVSVSAPGTAKTIPDASWMMVFTKPSSASLFAAVSLFRSAIC